MVVFIVLGMNDHIKNFHNSNETKCVNEMESLKWDGDLKFYIKIFSKNKYIIKVRKEP